VKEKIGIPMVTTFYGIDMSLTPRDPKWARKYKVLFAQGERFLAEGTHMRRCLIELGCPEAKVIVQHLGVDLGELAFVPRKIGPDGLIHVLVAGGFKEKKGIPSALEAFARVRQRYKNLRLTLIGDSSGQPREEEEKQRIVEVMAKHHLNGSVRWLGYQTYPVFRKILGTHHLFLSPSVTARDGDSEGGSPVSITEAQATGMPIISTFHADIPDVVLHGKSGLLSREHDLDALTANLEYLVDHPELWEAMGRSGREHIEHEYNIEIQARKLEEIYSVILEGNYVGEA
jgi:colanic acid/amylovoran biosynthesis glycosyltransferase